MAAVIGDYVPDLSRFHGIISTSASIQQHQGQQHSSHDPSPAYRPSARPRPSSVLSAPRSLRPDASSTSTTSTHPPQKHPQPQPQPQLAGPPPPAGPASRFPSPPPASSSPTATPGPAVVKHGQSESMAPHGGGGGGLVSTAGRPRTSPAEGESARRQQQQQQQQQPSPPDDFPIAEPGASSESYLVASPGAAPRIRHDSVVRVRDLAHIEALVRAESAGTGILQDPPLHRAQYEISGMPIGDIIEMVAALLTKITATNDLQHDAMQRNAAHQQQASANADAAGGGGGSNAQMSPLSHSVLAFHGKNVPAITILSYLSRIHKYCPTTYEVFLSLLVYFDRMTERVNELVMKSEEAKRRQGDEDGSENGSENDDDEDEDEAMTEDSAAAVGRSVTGGALAEHAAISPSATYFVVDSFNIHRLIIAGVTCSSKFFSDVFYTNSRYAKVGGLPLAELNHLEIQFLILNDFRLAVPVEDLETYATMLVEFYAREVVAPRRG